MNFYSSVSALAADSKDPGTGRRLHFCAREWHGNAFALQKNSVFKPQNHMGQEQQVLAPVQNSIL